MFHAKTIVPAALWAALVTTTACDEPAQGRPPPPWHGLEASPEDEGLLLAERAFLVDAEPGAELEVAPDALVFHGVTVREDDDWQPGDLLVHGAGQGFLRRVVDVDAVDGETVVTTEEAELHELVAQGAFHGQFRPFSEGLRLDDDVEIGDIVADAAAQGRAPALDQLRARVDAQAGLDVQGGYIELSPTTLVSAGGVSLDLTGGHFSFDPDLAMDVDFGWWSIDRFEVLATGTMDAELELRLGSDGEYELLDRSMTLWESPRYAWYGFIGPVPVVVVTRMELGATVSVSTHGPSSVTVGAGVGSWVEVGAIYDDAGWTLVGDHGFELRHRGPEFVLETELNARVALDGILKVELYGVVGPQLRLSPWAQLDADARGHWSADMGVRGHIGGAISLPWSDDIAVEGELFDWSQRLAEGQL
jgi:hypothetical protein